MRRIALFVGSTLCLLGLGFATENQAHAQALEVTGPLKGAPAVRHLRLYREGRIELAPSFSATLLDEYRRTMLVGLRANYGITDWLSVGVWGAYGAVGMTTSLTEQIDSNASRTGLVQMNVAPQGQFKNQVGRIDYMAFGQVTLVPFRGKLSLFQSIFSDVDFYIFAGAGVIGTKERASCGLDASGNVASDAFPKCATVGSDGAFAMTSQTKFAPTWGLGFNMYMTDFLSLGLEYRMNVLSWNASGFDSKGQDAKGQLSSSGKFPDGVIDSKDQSTGLQQMFSVYIGFTLPTKPHETD